MRANITVYNVVGLKTNFNKEKKMTAHTETQVHILSEAKSHEFEFRPSQTKT